MNRHGVRAALFDFGGVLAEEGFSNGLMALAREQGLAAEELARAGVQAIYDSGYVTGQGTAADFWALLRQRSGLLGEDAVLTERILTGFKLRPRMLELVRRLRAHGYATGLLSDQTDWLDELDRRAPFKDLFDRIYNSYYLGKGKGDPSLFADVARDLGVPPSTLMFVDDNIGHVNRARAAGYEAMLFTDQETCLEAFEQLLT